MKTEVVNHVVVWVQKRRVRIFHEGAKILDVPTNIHAGAVFEKMHFPGWDAGSWPMISNLKITSAAPDTRSKLITEGKLVTYGIYFDVNKADIRSESYGTLRDIAQVLKDPGLFRMPDVCDIRPVAVRYFQQQGYEGIVRPVNRSGM